MAYMLTTIPKELVYQDYPLFVAVNGVSNNKKRKTTPHFVRVLGQIWYKMRKTDHVVRYALSAQAGRRAKSDKTTA